MYGLYSRNSHPSGKMKFARGLRQQIDERGS